MGFFGPYCFKTKNPETGKKEKWYVHRHEGKGRRLIYHLSKDSRNAIDLPPGFEVVVSPKSGIPILRKKVFKTKQKES